MQRRAAVPAELAVGAAYVFLTLADVWQTLRGPFSTLSKPILQTNTRLKALDEICNIYILLLRSDVKISAKVVHFLKKIFFEEYSYIFQQMLS